MEAGRGGEIPRGNLFLSVRIKKQLELSGKNCGI